MTVNLVEPGTLTAIGSTRSTSASPRFSDSGARGPTSGLDIYNITNAAPVLTYNETYVPNQAVGGWLTPTSVLQARFIKVSAQFDF